MDMGMEIKGGDRIPLSKLGGELRPVELPNGTKLLALWFECPVCEEDHWHMIPFHEDDPADLVGIGKVWRLVSGIGGISMLTLAPSYNSGCLHAFIRRGGLEVL